MRILFVNHTAASSGAELALMRLIEALRQGHEVALACPAHGPLADQADAAGIPRFPVPAFEASMRLHPYHTPVGLARLVAGGVKLARVASRFEADLLHANTTRAGLMGSIAVRLGGPPVVVRAHEVVPISIAVGRGVRDVLTRSAGAVVAVSEDIAQRFNDGLPRPFATHVYNSFDRSRFDPSTVPPAPVREELGIAPDAPLLAQIAQISPWKAQDTSIRALAELRRAGLDAHLLVVGEVSFSGPTFYDNPAFHRGLHELVDQLDLGEAVHFLGHRTDVPGILAAIDLSLLPSWDEPFANVMLESMAMGTPLLVSEVGGASELVEDGRSGRLLPPKRPELWAAAARQLLTDRAALARMGEHALQATGRFNDEAHARDMLAVYARVLGASQPVPVPEERPKEATWPG